jgi:sugar phosphate isomerase/epimerase
MMTTRRQFLAAASGSAVLAPLSAKSKIPVGLELYSVRDLMKTDMMGTIRAVAKMGYEGVEFYSPYAVWSVEQAKDVRKLLDELGLKCWSTHNSAKVFQPEGLGKVTELNGILGSRMIIMASAGGRIDSIDGWKTVAETLAKASETLKKSKMRAGFHNHQTEFIPLGGMKPIEVLASNTPKDVVLQLDVGTCVHSGSDPVAWIEKNPGRIRSIHCKEWSPDASKGYKVLFGEGSSPWKAIFAAAEKSGGVEHYLIEQEGSAMAPLETVQKCLDNLRKLRA